MADLSSYGIGGEKCLDTDACSARSESSSSSYEDESDLVLDMQELLCDAMEIADTFALVGPDPPDEISVHSQMLSWRSSHFATALRPPWRQEFLRLSSYSPDAFRDILEFLYTGAVRLEVDTGSSVAVAAAADFAGILELEELALLHIDDCLTPSNFSAHLKVALSLPGRVVSDGLVHSLSQFAARYPARILTSTSLSREPLDISVPIVRTIWLLLAHDIDACERMPKFNRPSRERSLAVEGLLAWSSRCALPAGNGSSASEHKFHGNDRVNLHVQALSNILDASTCDEEVREALVSVFTSCSARTFAKRIEPLGLLSDYEILRKYRSDAERGVGEPEEWEGTECSIFRERRFR